MSTQAHRRLAAVAAAAALLASAAGAQTIFRCGDSYSQSPCADAKILEATPAPSAAQRSEAHAVAAREKLLALEMVQERHEREQAIRPAMAGSLGPAPTARAASAPPRGKKHASAKKRPAVDDSGRDFIASVPKAKKNK
jgi:hypothetical protein